MQYPYDLSHYKLTLPVDKAGKYSGSAAEIKKLNGYESPFFRLTDAGLVFLCPDHGATTDNAKYPRSELRDLNEFSQGDTVEDKVKLKVLACPEGQKIVIHQIHDDEAARVKVVWYQKNGVGRVYALLDDGTNIPMLDGLKLGASVICYLSFDKGKLKIKANSTLKTITPSWWNLNGAYFKRGNYFQSNSNKGLSATVLHCK